MQRQQSRHPELAEEQIVLDAAYVLAEEKLHQQSGDPVGAVNNRAANLIAEQRAEQAEALRRVLADAEPLFFGRVDYETDADWLDGQQRHYIGKIGLLDGDGDALVLSWKADAAQAFYQASRADPMGVARRRSFRGRDRLLTELSDEIVGALPAHLAGAAEYASPQDMLLAQLERERDGAMRDIVASIQADQDRLIRADLDTNLVIQGGPGTGKTAVGLHRASYVLFRYRETLGEDDALVVAPNQTFLSYIERVLPGLGDETVRHATVSQLGPQVITLRSDSREAVVVKGDARMAVVLRAYLYGRVQRSEDPLPLLDGEVSLDPAVVNEAIERAVASAATYNGGRTALREGLINAVGATQRRAALDAQNLMTRARRDTALERALTRLWPSMSPQQLVADVLTGTRRLATASAGVLTSAERAAIGLPAIERLEDMQWSPADIPLLDEATWLLDGIPAAYKHLIVDEAQDLSPMQLRMLGRRVATGSMTVLGDLAQGTSPWAPSSWDEVAEHLGLRSFELHELRMGYRVPAEVMEEANRLLDRIGVRVPPVESVRRTGRAPSQEDLTLDDALVELTELARQAAYGDAMTGVIVPDELYDDVRDAFVTENVKFGDGARSRLTHRVTLVPTSLAKGLEFDHAIVLDGGVESKGDSTDARELYVAMTRAVHDLTLITAPRPTPDDHLDYDMPDTDSATHTVPAIRFEQDGVTLYVAALPARILSDVGVVHEFDPNLPEDHDEQGYQRAVMTTHAKQIAKYLLDPEHNRLMPTAATLTARRRLEFQPVGMNGQQHDFGLLELARPIYIVDGQHRTAGFSIASEQDEEIAEFPRPVVIMEGVSKLDEVRQFQTINSTPKKVRTDLADRLLRQLGEFEDPTRSWKARALDVTDLLNTNPKSLWRGGITMPNGARGIATQRTMTESLKGILTGVFRTQEVEVAGGALMNLWGALRDLMPEAFAEPKDHVIQKTVGVFAWHEVAEVVFMRCLSDGRDLSQARIEDMLRETGEYVDATFWMSRKHGGTAPNYGGRGGFSALAQEIIQALPRAGSTDSSIIL